MSEVDVPETLTTTLAAARERLAQAEAVAAVIPRLRREIRLLENTLASLTGTGPAPRTGPTIAQRITEAISTNGTLTFDEGKMLPSVHGIVGGRKSSVQVELHRLIREGAVLVDRGPTGRPVALRLPADAEVVPLSREG